MDNCIFCKIVKKDIPSEIVYEDDKYFAFLDINPVVFGHVLVIPKKHYPKMKDLDDKEIGEIFVLCKKLMGKIKEGLKCDYVALSVVGVDVDHFHIHLIPRWFDDGLAGFWPTKKYESGKMKEYGKKLRDIRD